MGIYDRDWYRSTLRKRQGLPPEGESVRRATYSPRAYRSTRTVSARTFSRWWIAVGWFGTGWLAHGYWPLFKVMFLTLN